MRRLPSFEMQCCGKRSSQALHTALEIVLLVLAAVAYYK